MFAGCEGARRVYQGGCQLDRPRWWEQVQRRRWILGLGTRAGMWMGRRMKVGMVPQLWKMGRACLRRISISSLKA